ncbi:putative membrane protein (TIGR02226 family) [Tenacibaculum gallaicum]|uniref:Putative membrane protein (TIGR02226 family) n=1 Tax=Tenacibaculum gallaicum TaxID=561505 RepID=A0A3E0I1J3_9FLAO|nr:BatA domain-containing protein [Tenacibaculum gallaicum]REH52589.1 putative membrane protein (TIGR02226 family) [Tenacibaculum gallaicum]
MQFKHPEILYFLAFLLIPILVHLFQLQRFVKVPFTNVAFLQKLVLQTRKSSRIKKWLILATRLLLLAALIFAFAQPYFSNHKANEEQHFFIYLDNSLSTNAIGEKGNLLQIATQEIIENSTEKTSYSLLTNDHFYANKTAVELKEELLKTTNTAKNRNLADVFLKMTSEHKSATSPTKNIVISDFQNTKREEINNAPENTSFVKLVPEQQSNVSIDSVFVDDNGGSNFNVRIIVKNQGNAKNDIPIAIYNNDKLLNKQTFSIEENKTLEVTFSVVKAPVFLGKVIINFNDTYGFDNSFYFTINANEKVNVLAIGEPNNFLQRIYTKEEFNFTSSSLQNTNYNLLDKQHLIVLNELKNIPETLINSLASYTTKGGNIVVIPSNKVTLSSYNNLFSKLNTGKLFSLKNDSLKVTTINYNHPLFKNVFEKKVANFQYPFVKSSFNTEFINASNLVSFENKQGFIKQIRLPNASMYWVAGSLNKDNSNFTNSPLIVPVFYNIGKQSLQLSKLYYTIDKQNTIDIDKQLGKDEVLNIVTNKSSFIPLQQTFQNKTRITTKDQPLVDGFYKVQQQNNVLRNIAFNYDKSESCLDFLMFSETNDMTISTSVKNTLENINDENKIQWLWKWFLGLAIVSLLLEILILKFFKP